MDALLLAVGNQFVALQTRVALNLVGSGNNTGGLDDGLKLWGVSDCLSIWTQLTYVLNCVVGNTDGAGLALGELGHGLPGIDNGNAVINFDITPGDSAVLDERKVLVAGLECNLQLVSMGIMRVGRCCLPASGPNKGPDSRVRAQQGSHREPSQQRRGDAGCSIAWMSAIVRMPATRLW